MVPLKGSRNLLGGSNSTRETTREVNNIVLRNYIRTLFTILDNQEKFDLVMEKVITVIDGLTELD